MIVKHDIWPCWILYFYIWKINMNRLSSPWYHQTGLVDPRPEMGAPGWWAGWVLQHRRVSEVYNVIFILWFSYACMSHSICYGPWMYDVFRRTRTYIWDCSDLTNPVMTSVYYAPENSIDHNLVSCFFRVLVSVKQVFCSLLYHKRKNLLQYYQMSISMLCDYR